MYIKSRSSEPNAKPITQVRECQSQEIIPLEEENSKLESDKEEKPTTIPAKSSSGEDEIIEMTRMGKLISKHMVDSVQTSAHVKYFV